MKIILSLLLILNTAFATESYTLARKVFENSSIPFISHTGSGRFGTYLTMEVQYAPVKELFKQIQGQLKNRGEAHITVVTPIEYYDVLQDKVSMKEIDAISRQMEIQSAEFEVVCLGKGEAYGESAYFIVVNSPDLVTIRKEIRDLYVSRGGDGHLFEADHYYPHITVGFTKQDLHESDGVLKDKSSCIAPISIIF